VPQTCATCGQPISPSIGECFYCPAPEAAQVVPDILRPPPLAPVPSAAPAVPLTLPVVVPPPPPAAPVPPAASAPDSDALHHQAEQALRAGEVERALVLASKVVKLRPHSIAARSLYERARRELVRGLRRERLDARVHEAERMMGVGDYRGAERIVTSALKLLPDHPVALELFGKVKARRLAGSDAAAEAERELHRLTVLQARQAFVAAHNAIANGWERRALLAVRRGLRLVPDDADLLALLRELQGAEGDQDPLRAHRRALLSQVRDAIALLRERKLEESLAMLRAVLREDPDNVRAQEAVRQVRRAWLRRTVPPVPRPAPAAAATTAVPIPRVEAPPTPLPAAARSAAAAPALAVPPEPPRVSSLEDTVPATMRAVRPPIRIAAPVPYPPARRVRPTPLILAAGGLAAVVMGALVMSRDTPPSSQPVFPPRIAPVTTPVPGETALAEPPGPLTGLDSGLRRTIEDTLSAYGRALETQDEESLARVRPDMSARERTALLAPFKGALNVATDLRVVDVAAGRDEALVTVLRTDVIVDGREGARAPVEETLRFVRRGGSWTLVGRRR
jgi:hypothetical protein